MGQAGARALVDEELIGIRASIMPHSDRLSAPDQRRAAAAEIAPAPNCKIAWKPIGGPVPAFHRLNDEAVSDLKMARLNCSPKRRVGPGMQFDIAGNRSVVAYEMSVKGVK